MIMWSCIAGYVPFMHLLDILTFLASQEICVTGQRSTDNKTERSLIHLDYKHMNEPGSVMPVVQPCTCSDYIFNILTDFFLFNPYWFWFGRNSFPSVLYYFNR